MLGELPYQNIKKLLIFFFYIVDKTINIPLFDAVKILQYLQLFYIILELDTMWRKIYQSKKTIKLEYIIDMAFLEICFGWWQF